MPMWRADELHPERLASDVGAGLFFLASVDGDAAGTIKFQLSDPEFWPDQLGDESAYLHRLAVRRQFAGRGVSSALLAWAVGRAAELGAAIFGWTARRHALDFEPSTRTSDSSTTATGRSGPISYPGTNSRSRGGAGRWR